MNIHPLLKYFIAMTVLGLFSAVILDQIILPGYVRQDQVRVLPNVVGMPLEEAAKLLRGNGFRAVKAYVTHTQKYPPNQVFEMYPKAYSKVKKGRIIQLTITEEERMVTVPPLVGKTIRAAEIEIARAGLEMDTVISQFHQKYKSGQVVWQNPIGGNLLRRGSGLSLIVSKGEPPQSYYVPAVVGLPYREGRRRILDAGLDIGSVKLFYAPSRLPDTILEQSISGGTVLKVKRRINLTVSTYTENRQ